MVCLLALYSTQTKRVSILKLRYPFQKFKELSCDIFAKISILTDIRNLGDSTMGTCACQNPSESVQTMVYTLPVWVKGGNENRLKR